MAKGCMNETTFDPSDLFTPATDSAWRKRVEAVLKGQAFEKLVSTTHEGLRIEPLYTRTSAGSRALRAQAGPWRIAQRVDHPDFETANRLALIDLENGADALTLVVAGAATARGFGLPLATPDDLDRALAGVELDLIALRLDAGSRAAATADLLAALVARRRLSSATLDIDVGYDPLGCFVRTATAPGAWAAIGTDLAKRLRDLGFAGATFMADGRPYHEAGAGEAQELALVLSTGVAYLRALEACGLPLDEARQGVAFLLAADADQFLGIAKFRALRALWARVEAACGLSAQPIRLHAETSWRMMTRRDPAVNILRTTMALFAAGIGMADSITLLPFTLALGLPDAAARRLARNAHLVLIEESHLATVADPAAGAGSFESLTHALCTKAWAQFQAIEKAGGLEAALAHGIPQADIAVTAEKRWIAIAHGRQPITGTSAFPLLAEAPVTVLAAAPALSADDTLRDAAPFEALRDEADARAVRPKLFLATLGPLAAALPRANFAKSFFEAGGIETILPEGLESIEAMAAAFAASGAPLACLCAPDELYAEFGEAAARALHASGVRGLYVAGRPGGAEAALRAAGVDDFVFVGCDMLAALGEALARTR